jgi:hypothetical protein
MQYASGQRLKRRKSSLYVVISNKQLSRKEIFKIGFEISLLSVILCSDDLLIIKLKFPDEWNKGLLIYNPTQIP